VEVLLYGKGLIDGPVIDIYRRPSRAVCFFGLTPSSETAETYDIRSHKFRNGVSIL